VAASWPWALSLLPVTSKSSTRQVPPANRGSAMGAFVAFLDIAYGISGPAAGVIAGHFGYAVVYLFGTACALAGAVLAAGSSSTQA